MIAARAASTSIFPSAGITFACDFGQDSSFFQESGGFPGHLGVAGDDDAGAETATREAPRVFQHQLPLAAVGAAGEENDLRLRLFQCVQPLVVEGAGEHAFDPGAGVECRLPRRRRGQLIDQADRRDPETTAGAGSRQSARRSPPPPAELTASASAAA